MVTRYNLKIKPDIPVSLSLIVILPSYTMLRDYMRIFPTHPSAVG